MGWRYRKSINLGGGFRINLSKSGIGYSWGVKGYRVTKTATGQTRRTYSIPGTGISYIETPPKNSVPPKIQAEEKRAITIGKTTYYTSENLDEMSRNDIVLKKIKDIHTLNYIANILCMLIVSLPIGLIIKLIIAIYGKINLEYEFDSYSKEKYNSLNTIITEMKKNTKMWRVNTSVRNADIKYSSGASNSITRNIINIFKGTPWYIKSNIDIYYIADGSKKIYLTPDRIIVLNGFKVLGCKYNNLDFNLFNSRFVEDGIVPKDTKIISYTWRYVNKDGGPDKRFNNNRQLPICDYGGLEVTSDDGINFRMQCSNIYIMAEVSKYLTKFVEIINKEIDSENTYYNFEEDDESDSNNNETIIFNDKENNLTNSNDDKNLNQTNNSASIDDSKKIESALKKDVIVESKTSNTSKGIDIAKKVLRIGLLSLEMFFTFLFVLMSFVNNMFLAGILWIIFGFTSFLTYKKHKWVYRIINIIIFIYAFYVFILFAPKEFDGTYKSDNNIQVILDRNKAEIICEDGIKLNGDITYKIDDNKTEVTIHIKGNNNYFYIFDRDNKILYENETIYYKVENT